ncbi:hypothetical protein D9611_008896 [Ephemerocybe angulata]|uniref:DUF6533 domain-containing protein n=1 Tax=Ephemerocybe angulata TaxID=980116 RepID=A0A8H5BYJ9_9AGAR|nr:hypothetical protein D9611_008896 [Tulosesus angulatus]
MDFEGGLNRAAGPKAVSILVSLTLLIFDYFLTLRHEVELVWHRKFTAGTALFLVNRYMPFIDLSISYQDTQGLLSLEQCKIREATVSWMILGGMSLSEVILILRTMAIWNSRRWVGVTLGAVFGLALGACIGITFNWLKTLVFISVPNNGGGCNLFHADGLVMISYVLLLVLETVIVALTALQARYHIHRGSSGWLMRLYQQGFLFYLYMLLITLANVICPLVAETHYKLVFIAPQRAVHSIFCNRVFFIVFKRQTSKTYNQTRTHSMGLIETMQIPEDFECIHEDNDGENDYADGGGYGGWAEGMGMGHSEKVSDNEKMAGPLSGVPAPLETVPRFLEGCSTGPGTARTP